MALERVAIFIGSLFIALFFALLALPTEHAQGAFLCRIREIDIFLQLVHHLIFSLSFLPVHQTSMKSDSYLVSTDNKGFASFRFEREMNPGLHPGEVCSVYQKVVWLLTLKFS